MRINIHERTPKNFKRMKITLIFLGIFMSVMPAFLACLFIVEAKAVLLGAITLILPVVLIYLWLRSMFYMTQSYAEFDDEKVVVVQCYAFRRRIKSIERNRIKQKESVFVTKSPGRPNMARRSRDIIDVLVILPIAKKLNYNYIVFKDENGQYLFKILDCPEGEKWADELMKKGEV